MTSTTRALLTLLAGSITGCFTAPVALVLEGDPVVRFDRSSASYPIRARAIDAYGRDVNGVFINYLSLDPSVAEVSAGGTITSKSDGRTRIVVLAGTAQQDLSVEVREYVKLELSATLLGIERGSSDVVHALAFDQAGFPIVDTKLVWFTRSHETVAVDQDGQIFTVAEGAGEVVVRGGGLERIVTVVVLPDSRELPTM